MTKFNHYRISVEVLTPLFIGSGENITKKEYAYDPKNKELYIIDNNKLINLLLRTGHLDSYEQFLLNYKATDLMKWLVNMKLDKNIDSYTKYKLKSEIHLSSNNYKESKKQRSNRNYGIELFVKDPYDKVIVPGSSIKGAIRTALIGSFYYDSFEQYEKEIKKEAEKIKSEVKSITENNIYAKKNNSKKLSLRRSRTLGDINKEESEKVFNESSKSNAILIDQYSRYITISDSDSINVDNLTLVQKVDVNYDGKETKLPIYRECLAPGTKFNFLISLPEKLPFTNKHFVFDIDKIFNSIDLKSENEFYFEEYDEINTNGALIRLGGGVGYINKTINYLKYDGKDALEISQAILNNLFKNKGHLDGETSPLVKKMTYYKDNLVPMGVCSLLYQKVDSI